MQMPGASKQPGSDVKDLSGCWSACGGCMCHYNFPRGDDSMCNLMCILCGLVPFPICRCFSRTPQDRLVWESCTDGKGNKDQWKLIDPDTIQVKGINECCGEMNSHKLKRGCCRM
jgi:hypothetical protein